MTTRRKNPPRVKVPKTTDSGVYKISVQSTCYDGCWIKEIDGDVFNLYQTDENHLALKINERDTGLRFKLYEQEITYLRLKNGKRLPQDKCFIFYVVDSITGKRVRFLYLYKSPRGRIFGTRKGCGLRHASSCMSKLQRKGYAEALKIRNARKLELRKKREEIRIARKIANYRLRIKTCPP
jgi:hypothetical protein